MREILEILDNQNFHPIYLPSPIDTRNIGEISPIFCGISNIARE